MPELKLNELKWLIDLKLKDEDQYAKTMVALKEVTIDLNNMLRELVKKMQEE